MAKATKPIIPLYQLRAIELHELIINKPALGAKLPVNFHFDIRVEANVDRAQKLVINNTIIKIKGDDKSETLGTITCACIFSVTNLDEVIILKSENQADINETFAELLNAISISTTRGVMFIELKGTFLHYAFLPIIDIKSLQKNVLL